MLEPRCAFQIGSLLGECPVWSSEEQKLYWIDILNGHIHCFDPLKKVNNTVNLGRIVSSIALRKQGNLILTLEKEIALFNAATHSLQIIGSPENHLFQNRFNDGKCDRQGYFWCTSMNQIDLQADSGALYRVSPNHKVEKMETHVILGNGMGWSPDNRTFYFTQTMRDTVFAYDFDPHSEQISNRRPFLTKPSPLGKSDGLTVDSEGFVWSVLYGAGQIVRCDPMGRIERIIQLPVPRVTSCAFGGKDLNTLFITTAREHMTQEEIERYPLSGSLFSLDLDIQGIEEPFYLG